MLDPILVERHVTLAFFAGEAVLGVAMLWAARLLDRPRAVRVWCAGAIIAALVETAALASGLRIYEVPESYKILIVGAIGVGEGGGGFTFIYMMAERCAPAWPIKATRRGGRGESAIGSE